MYEGLVAVCSRTFSKNQILRSEMKLKFKNIRFNDKGEKLEGHALVHFLKDCEGAIIALEEITDEVVKGLPQLKVISKYGVGLNNVNPQRLIQNNIQLGWTGGVNKRSVSELTLGFILALSRNITRQHTLLKSGVWKQSGGTLLSNKKVGIIGCGFIGKDLIELLRPFGCEIYINDLIDLSEFVNQNLSYKNISISIESKETIYKTCDIISLHLPLTELTKNLITSKELSLMQENAILINTGRGEIVNENDLYCFLKDKKIGGAAFDVYAKEPPTNLNLFTLDNFIGTPHIGGSSNEAILAMGRSAIINLKNLLS